MTYRHFWRKTVTRSTEALAFWRHRPAAQAMSGRKLGVRRKWLESGILTCNNRCRADSANEIVDLIVVCTIAAPDTTFANIVKTETLRPGHQGLQQPLGRADVFSCDQVVNFRSHSRAPPLCPVSISFPLG